jgi:hypothetical protein
LLAQSEAKGLRALGRKQECLPYPEMPNANTGNFEGTRSPTPHKPKYRGIYNIDDKFTGRQRLRHPLSGARILLYGKSSWSTDGCKLLPFV